MYLIQVGVVFTLGSNSTLLLPSADEVWGKVICLQACVCPQGRSAAGRSAAGGWCLLLGVHGPGGGLLPGSSAPGGCVCCRGVPGEDPPTATAAGGTDLTGMHSCCPFVSVLPLLHIVCLNTSDSVCV